MDVILNWKGRMLFEGVGGSGFVQKLDTDASVGGDDSGARPMEFIALGLAGCTAGRDVDAEGMITASNVPFALTKTS